MPMGILVGEWQTDEVIKNIIDNSNRKNPYVIFEKDPKVLVQKLIEMVKEQQLTGEREHRL
jgi:hypothetical protein